MLTKKDFEIIAEHLGKGKFAVVCLRGLERGYIRAIEDVADALKAINPRFDRELFSDTIDRYYEKAGEPKS